MAAPAHLFSVSDRSLEQLIAFVDHSDGECSCPHEDVAVAVDLELELPHLSMILLEGAARGGAHMAHSVLPPRWWEHAPEAFRAASALPVVAAIESLHDDSVLRDHADQSLVPVLNAGSDHDRPLQVLADLLVLHDLLGHLRGRSMVITDGDPAYIRSWVQACVRMGIDLTLLPAAVPANGLAEFDNDRHYASLFGSRLDVAEHPALAVSSADIVAGDKDLPSTEYVLNRVVFPLDLAGLHAELGSAGGEGPRTLLFHRVERSKDVVAAFVSGRL